MDYGNPIWCLLVCGSWIGWSALYKFFFVICGCLLVKPWRVGLGLCYLKLKVVTCLWFSSGLLLLFTAQQNPSLYFGAAIYLWYQRLLVFWLDWACLLVCWLCFIFKWSLSVVDKPIEFHCILCYLRLVCCSYLIIFIFIFIFLCFGHNFIAMLVTYLLVHVLVFGEFILPTAHDTWK